VGLKLTTLNSKIKRYKIPADGLRLDLDKKRSFRKSCLRDFMKYSIVTEKK